MYWLASPLVSQWAGTAREKRYCRIVPAVWGEPQSLPSEVSHRQLELFQNHASLTIVAGDRMSRRQWPAIPPAIETETQLLLRTESSLWRNTDQLLSYLNANVKRLGHQLYIHAKRLTSRWPLNMTSVRKEKIYSNYRRPSLTANNFLASWKLTTWPGKQWRHSCYTTETRVIIWSPRHSFTSA